PRSSRVMSPATIWTLPLTDGSFATISRTWSQAFSTNFGWTRQTASAPPGRDRTLGSNALPSWPGNPVKKTVAIAVPHSTGPLGKGIDHGGVIDGPTARTADPAATGSILGTGP